MLRRSVTRTELCRACYSGCVTCAIRQKNARVAVRSTWTPPGRPSTVTTCTFIRRRTSRGVEPPVLLTAYYPRDATLAQY